MTNVPGPLTVESPPCKWGPYDSKPREVLFGWPVTSWFGGRADPLGRGRGWHGGVDLGMPTGTPLLSPSATKVISAGWDPGGGGNWITLEDLSSNDRFGFGHLDKIQVRVGALLAPGELIGYSGNTGGSTGPHLHLAFESAGDPDLAWDDPFPLFQALEDAMTNGGPVDMPLSNDDITKIANAVAATLTGDDNYRASMAEKVWWAVSGQARNENIAAGPKGDTRWTKKWATLDQTRDGNTLLTLLISQVARKLGAKLSVNKSLDDWDPADPANQWPA